MTVSFLMGIDHQDAKPLVKYFYGAFGKNKFRRERIPFVSLVVADKSFLEISL